MVYHGALVSVYGAKSSSAIAFRVNLTWYYVETSESVHTDVEAC